MEVPNGWWGVTLLVGLLLLVVSTSARGQSARARVASLGTTVSALGNADGPALKQEALSNAKKATQVAPIAERLEACSIHRACQEAPREI